MNRLLALFLYVLCFSGTCYSQFKLDLEISGIRNNKGAILLQLFDENEKVLNQEKGPITDNKCLFSFTNLRAGKYAVRYYHDENQNCRMETNLVGKPAEGYGFSNNVTGRFGPPPFEKWLFEMKRDTLIVLNPTY